MTGIELFKTYLGFDTCKQRIALAAFVFICALITVLSPKSAYATCGGAIIADCQAATQQINQAVDQYHDQYRDQINDNVITQQLDDHQTWLVDDYFIDNIFPAMAQMAEQLSAIGMQQVAIIGQFFDAKHQLETQRALQELQNEAHKDYQPSEDFCWFGTNVRSLAHSEQLSTYSTKALNTLQMKRQLGTFGVAGADSRDSDKLIRWEQFTSTYCDPEDNNKISGSSNTGLAVACNATGGGATERINIDVDYTRLIEEPRTLDISYGDAPPATDDEQDVFALAQNLYGHEPLTRDVNAVYLKEDQYQNLYLALRTVAAKRSVAISSFNAIVGMKSSGSSDITDPANEPKTREFLAAIMVELGVPEADVYKVIGENPSYYAQLEILAKKIYQSPDFYSNLYDKPANVKRKGVALKAIELMVDRAIYESQIRQEMAMSVLLSAKLKSYFDEVNKQLSSARN